MYTYNGEDYNRETGLQYLRARWYDTNRAVFISEDSYLGDLLQPLTRNRYLYVCNNPLNFIDPTGHINWSRQLKYLTATVLGLAVGAAALAAFPATIAVGVGAAAVTFLMANAVMNKAEAMVQISSNSKKLAENRKTLENTTAKLNYIQSRFGTNEERMPSDVRAEVYKLKSTMKTISEQNRQLCDSNAYYQKQDAAGNAQLQMALGTISLVLAPYAGLALAGGGTMAGMTGAALGTNAGIGLAIGGFDYNEAYTGKNPAKDFLGANTYEDVRTISNLVSGETVIAGASGVQAIENARRADEIGKISQNANVAGDGIIGESGSKTPSEIARSWQGTGKYPGIDDYVDITVEKGTVLYRGEPNGTEYFTTLEAIEQSGRDATKLFEGLQVEKNPIHGYRGEMQGYIFNGDVVSAYGITNANPQFGKGGLPQYYVPNVQYLIDKGILTPLDNIK
mgnify:CR=1 FL=1